MADRKNWFFLFPIRKASEKAPEMKGSGSFTCPHCNKDTEIDVAGWKSVSKAGKNYISGKIQQHDDNAYAQKRKEYDEKAQEVIKNRDDEPDLPF